MSPNLTQLGHKRIVGRRRRMAHVPLREFKQPHKFTSFQWKSVTLSETRIHTYIYICRYWIAPLTSKNKVLKNHRHESSHTRANMSLPKSATHSREHLQSIARVHYFCPCALRELHGSLVSSLSPARDNIKHFR